MKLAALLSAFTLLPISASAIVLAGFPIFSDDFESGPGGWTVGSEEDPATSWELGTPINVGPSGAHSGLNVFGTNITGIYGSNAYVWLRSPVIDLIGLPDATLSYFEFRDIEADFDFGHVSILRASDQTELARLGDPVSGLVDWTETSHALPGGVLGETIQVEFRFSSDIIQNFAGWYIDDVTITSTVPEPDVMGLFGVGALLLVRRRHRS